MQEECVMKAWLKSFLKYLRGDEVRYRIGHGTMLWYPQLSNIGTCSIGRNCTIHSHVWIGDGVIIGNNVSIQAFSFIPPKVMIYDNVFIGPRVTFTNDKQLIPGNRNWLTTRVREGARIGAGCVILPGITIGKNALIGAGSVVTKCVPDGETWVGNPARRINYPTEHEWSEELRHFETQ